MAPYRPARPGPGARSRAFRDTLIVPGLDRFARSVPDARSLADLIISRGARLQIGPAVYDPADPFGKMFFNILASFAEFEVDIIRPRTIEGMARASYLPADEIRQRLGLTR
jgi:DNA invertase Pin-like site-specific DNA recombinase